MRSTALARSRQRERRRLATVPALATGLIRTALHLLCRVEAEELAKIPLNGPLIIIINHVNFLEIPLLYTHLYPRDIIGMAKKESWDNPALAYLGRIWGAIALDRQHSDFGAMRSALRALADGRILVIAPEGTRSGDGRLRQGHGGVVQLALRSGAPILPLAHIGGERFWRNLRGVRRTSFRIRVGRPFRLRPTPSDASKSLRAGQIEAVMRQLATLLPSRQRGVYATLAPQTDERYLEFI